MLGSTINYCSSNPPDAATLAILAAKGDSANIISCGYSTGQPNLPTNAGIHPAGQTIVQTPTPYDPYNYNYPGYENCDPRDSACVERNTVRAADWQNQYYQTQAAYQNQLCKANAAANGQSGANCDVMWPAGYAGNVPATNVPATSSPTLTDLVPGVANTSPANAGTTSTTGSTVLPSLPDISNAVQNISSSVGISSSTLGLIVAAVGIFLITRK